MIIIISHSSSFCSLFFVSLYNFFYLLKKVFIQYDTWMTKAYQLTLFLLLLLYEVQQKKKKNICMIAVNDLLVWFYLQLFAQCRKKVILLAEICEIFENSFWVLCWKNADVSGLNWIVLEIKDNILKGSVTSLF